MRPPAGCQLDDEDAWHAANPGLRLGIKSARYMADRARLAAAGADEADFRAHDLNQNQDPAAKRIVRLADWEAVEAIEAPRSGPVCVGVDIGGSSSMTAAVGWWPESGRMEAWGAFPGEPNLVDRGQADGVGDRYQRMQNRGELTVFPGRSTPVASFLAHVAELLDGYDVIACGADRYRRAEVEDAMTAAALNWPIAWVGQGAGAVADGKPRCTGAAARRAGSVGGADRLRVADGQRDHGVAVALRPARQSELGQGTPERPDRRAIGRRDRGRTRRTVPRPAAGAPDPRRAARDPFRRWQFRLGIATWVPTCLPTWV